MYVVMENSMIPRLIFLGHRESNCHVIHISNVKSFIITANKSSMNIRELKIIGPKK